MMEKSLWITIAAFILAGGYYLSIGDSPHLRKTPSTALKKRLPPQFASESDIQKFQPQDFREWVDYFTEAKAVDSPMDRVVKEGETIITEGYESTPGNFIFTSLTPRIITSGERPSVEIQIKTFSGSLAGASPSIFAIKTNIDPRYGRDVFFRAEGKMQSVSISAVPNPSTGEIRVKIKSQSESK